MASDAPQEHDELTMFEIWGWKRRRENENKRRVGVSRVVPNGVDATTAEWEGGAVPFIRAGRGFFLPLHHLTLYFQQIY